MAAMSRKRFFGLVRARFGIQPLPLVSEAYQMSKAYHRPQLRKSGERYFEHPRAVALILLESPDTTSDEVIIALLHDIVEDCHILPETIGKVFGLRIAAAVTAMSKNTVILAADGEIIKHERPEHEYRAGLTASPADFRRPKCADRIHNLRTMLTLSAEHRRRKATETMEFYMPLARQTDPVLFRLMARALAKVLRSLEPA